jgi:hypothetical protein
MKHILTLVFTCIFSCGLHAQTTDATVCDILDKPLSFNGKIVRIKGTVAVGFDYFIIKGDTCNHRINGIWLSYPEGTKAKSGPAAIVQIQAASNFKGDVPASAQTAVTLDKSKDFKQFDSYLSTAPKVSGTCLGCIKYEVSATLVGRLDAIENASLRRDKDGKIAGIGGYGNLNAYKARLVLESVSDVTPTEIDYSAVAEATKAEASSGDNGGPGGRTDQSSSTYYEPRSSMAKLVKAAGAGSSQDQLQRAADAYGKDKENNGVVIAKDPTGELLAKYDGKASVESPDGLLFICRFNSSRLSGETLTKAYLHLGAHIADVRTPSKGFENASLYEYEYRGWVASVLGTVMGQQKTMSAPGGYLFWNSTWPAAENNDDLNKALTEFLNRTALLKR